MPTLDETRKALQSPALYESGTAPELVETHISVVALSEHDVYKLKKPVKFGFVDFSSLEKRRVACEAEVQVNRRLGPDVYLGVVPLSRSVNGTWEIGAGSEVVDWLVHMRRLPSQICAKNLLLSGNWREKHTRAIIDLLTRFYRTQASVPIENYLEEVRKHVFENTQELLRDRIFLNPAHGEPRSAGFEVEENEVPGENFGQHPPHAATPATRVHMLCARQQFYLFTHAAEFERRQAAGHLVEGHGDLRADHLYLSDPPVAIDGLEFDIHLRVLDIADELSFLQVSFESCGAPEVGRQILEATLAALDDAPPKSLLSFYRAYRATVRCKVAALREEQTHDPAEESHALRWLNIAAEHAESLPVVPVILVRGLSGTGKSTLARAIAEQTGATHLATDAIRHRLQFEATSRYTEENRSQVYEELLIEAESRLQTCQSLVVDGTFLVQDLLDSVVRRLGVGESPIVVVTCQCPQAIVLERLQKRAPGSSTFSEAGTSVYHLQSDEVITFPESVLSITIDTSQPLDRQLTTVRKVLLEMG